MITSVPSLPAMPEDDVAACRIACLFAAYRQKEKIARFYRQSEEESRTTAVMSECDGYMNLCAADGDREELLSFLHFLSPKGVFCEEQIGNSLGLVPHEKLTVLKKNVSSPRSSGVPSDFQVRAMVRQLNLSLPAADEDGMTADLSFRLRHGTAYAVYEPYGSAVLLTGENRAFLSALAVLPDRRKKGLGSALLGRVLENCPAKTVFVCTEQKNERFYQNNGFVFSGAAANFGVKK